MLVWSNIEPGREGWQLERRYAVADMNFLTMSD
jgi:hypothetical protein